MQTMLEIPSAISLRLLLTDKRVGPRIREVISTARATEAVGYRLHATLYSMDSRTQSISKTKYASRLADNYTAKS